MVWRHMSTSGAILGIAAIDMPLSTCCNQSSLLRLSSSTWGLLGGELAQSCPLLGGPTLERHLHSRLPGHSLVLVSGVVDGFLVCTAWADGPLILDGPSFSPGRCCGVLGVTGLCSAQRLALVLIGSSLALSSLHSSALCTNILSGFSG